jgi:hypothetical protein
LNWERARAWLEDHFPEVADFGTDDEEEATMSDTPDPARYMRYARAVTRDAGAILTGTADAVLAVADEEQADLRAEVARLRVACTEFEDAYVGEHEDRVKAEEELERVREQQSDLEQTKRGARELGRILDRTLRDALDASGRHDAIDEDGDGDWAVVWETLAALRPRAEAAEAKVRAVEVLADEWWNKAEHGEDERYGRIIARTLRGCADSLHEVLGGCCTACKGEGYGYGGEPCWDCRGTGHPHPRSDENTEERENGPAVVTPPAEPCPYETRYALHSNGMKCCDEDGA